MAFTLPGRGAATLELLNVTGRRVLRRDVGSLGPGPHVVALEPRRPLGAGPCFLVLKRGAQALRSRVAIIP